jgi:GNAT superfamily N-acetyltransferase
MIEFKSDLPSSLEFKRLYDTTGWGADRPVEFYQGALEGSWFVISVWLEGKLIGFGRVISDGALHAFITEMIVDPKHQARGVGQGVLERLVRHCLDAGITDIQLFCAKGKRWFYERFGFVARADDAPGMQYRP